MKVTIRDIAKAAHVSPATVSNSFSGNNRVSKETRLRVLELARQMGYQEPNQMPLNKRIHLVVFHKDDQFLSNAAYLSEIISGIENACRKNLYRLNIIHLSPDAPDEMDAILREQHNPVLLLGSEMSSEDLRPFLQVRAPLILLDNHSLNICFPTFHVDNLKAGYIVGEYLFRQGHRKIGMVTSDPITNNAMERQAGLSMALEAYDLRLNPDDIIPVHGTRMGARHGMLRWLEWHQGPLPTALFAFNDQAAAGVMDALQAKGIRVPEDISLVGMDNMSFDPEISPALTSVHVPRYAMGYQAVEQLLLQITHSAGLILKTAVDVYLHERDSVATIG